jgi:4-amino-4-deoxy-L-arabinose transferase-like glycosyltransferase
MNDHEGHKPGKNTARDSRQFVTALFFCLVGFSLLIYQLDQKSLWGDETYRVYTTDVALGDLDGFINNVRMHVLPPLYPLLLWVWRAITGSSEFALRFPSVTFATISLALVYRLAVTMLGRGAGVMVLALSAVSPFLLLSARMVQYYSLLLLLCTASYWLFLQLLHGQGTRLKWAAYAVICAMAMYTQYFAAFVLATQGVVALTQIRKRRDFLIRFLAAQAFVVLLFAPAISILVSQSVGRYGGQDAFSTASLLISTFALVYPFFAWTVGGSILPWNPLGLLGAVIGLSLAAIGLWAVATERWSDHGVQVAADASRQETPQTRSHGPLLLRTPKGGIPMALTYLAFISLPLCLSVFTLRLFSGASGDPFAINRAVFSVPFLYLLIGAGIVAVNRPALRLLTVVALAVVAGVSMANYYRGLEFHNPLYVLQTEALAEAILQQARPGDVFVRDEMTTFGYYITKANPDAIHFHATQSEDAREYIARYDPDSVWLILVCRAVETESSATLLLTPWLPGQGYRQQVSFGHAPQDETLARAQELVLRRPACTHKIAVIKYTRIL